MHLIKGLWRPVDCCGQQGLGQQQQSAMTTGREQSATLKHHGEYRKWRKGVEVGPSCRQLVEAALDTGWGWQTPEEPGWAGPGEGTATTPSSILTVGSSRYYPGHSQVYVHCICTYILKLTNFSLLFCMLELASSNVTCKNSCKSLCISEESWVGQPQPLLIWIVNSKGYI